MRLTVFCAALTLLALPAASLSKPLLLNSEDTYASVCLEGWETPERLLQICELALESPSATTSQRLEMMDTMAWAYVDLGQAKEGCDLFADMRTLNPMSTLGLNGLGWCAWDDDDYDAAVGYFEQALGVSFEAESLAGVASSKYRGGMIDLTEAAEGLEAAHAMDPDYIWPIREIGWFAYDEGDYETAEAAFRRAVEYDPEDASAHFGLSNVLHEVYRYEEALEHANLALEYGGESLDYMNERVLNLLFLDRYRVAENEADRMIDMWPDEAEGHVLKARARYYSGRGAEAFEGLKTFAQDEAMDPSETQWASYWLASLYESDGRSEDVLTVIEGITDDGERPSYHHTMAFWAAYSTDKLGRAKEARDALLRQDAQSPEGAYYDALFLAMDRSFDAAEARVEEALSFGYDAQELETFYGLLAKHGEYVRLIQFKLRLSDAAKAE